MLEYDYSTKPVEKGGIKMTFREHIEELYSNRKKVRIITLAAAPFNAVEGPVVGAHDDFIVVDISDGTSTPSVSIIPVKSIAYLDEI